MPAGTPAGLSGEVLVEVQQAWREVLVPALVKLRLQVERPASLEVRRHVGGADRVVGVRQVAGVDGGLELLGVVRWPRRVDVDLDAGLLAVALSPVPPSPRTARATGSDRSVQRRSPWRQRPAGRRHSCWLLAIRRRLGDAAAAAGLAGALVGCDWAAGAAGVDEPQAASTAASAGVAARPIAVRKSPRRLSFESFIMRQPLAIRACAML